MAAGLWTPTNTTRLKMVNGQFDWDSDTWKVALFTSASNLGASSTTYAGVTSEVANGNGYTTGGITVTFTLSGTTEVIAYFSSNPTWTASGGSITSRRAAIYESGGDVAFYCLIDSTNVDVVTPSGTPLIISTGTSNPVFRLS